MKQLIPSGKLYVLKIVWLVKVLSILLLRAPVASECSKCTAGNGNCQCGPHGHDNSTCRGYQILSDSPVGPTIPERPLVLGQRHELLPVIANQELEDLVTVPINLTTSIVFLAWGNITRRAKLF